MTNPRLEPPNFSLWEHLDKVGLHKLRGKQMFFDEDGKISSSSWFANVTKYRLFRPRGFLWGYDVDVFGRGVILKVWGNGVGQDFDLETAQAALFYEGIWHLAKLGERVLCIVDIINNSGEAVRVTLGIFDADLNKKLEVAVDRRRL